MEGIDVSLLIDDVSDEDVKEQFQLTVSEL